MIRSGVIYYPASIPGKAYSNTNSPYSLFKSNGHSRFILRQDMKILCKTASRDILPSYYLSGELCKTSQENIQKSVKARKQELGTFGEMFKIISTFFMFYITESITDCDLNSPYIYFGLSRILFPAYTFFPLLK